MKFNQIERWTFPALLIAGLLFVQMGCRKPKDTIAKIIVKDAVTEAVIAGAKVVLFGQSTQNQQGKVVVGDTTTTNAAGEAIFDLSSLYKPGQAGVAVLNISATYGDSVGSGIIKVEEETTTTETVFIQE